MSKVGIVCDSTCDLGLDYFEQNDVVMVPLKVQIGDETFLDWVDLSPTDFYERQKIVVEMPTTSQPTPAEFADAYRQLANSGVDDIVVVTLTSALSGTYESATMAATDATIPVHVIDTKTVSQATGLVVKAAVAARDAGGNGQDVKEAIDWTISNTRFLFVLDTMAYLVKGGRAGKATGLAASILNIKPILQFNSDGIIEPFAKVKGLNKALGVLADFVTQESRSQRLRVAFLHAMAPDLMRQLKTSLDEAGADYEVDSFGEIGSVIGNYAGAGAVGLAFHPAKRA